MIVDAPWLHAKYGYLKGSSPTVKEEIRRYRPQYSVASAHLMEQPDNRLL
jgi:hypothetical protein